MSDKVKSRLAAISFNPVQNASSKLTLVLCPAITIERLTTGDFIGFSCLDTVLVQLAAKSCFVPLGERAVSFRHTVGNSCFGSPFLGTLTIGPLPSITEIDDLSHARSLFPKKEARPLSGRLLSWPEHRCNQLTHHNAQLTSNWT